MSTPIWDSGDLVASIAAVRCDRCDTMGPCVQLSTHGDRIQVCLRKCFLELAYAAGKYAGDGLREAMGQGMRCTCRVGPGNPYWPDPACPVHGAKKT